MEQVRLRAVSGRRQEALPAFSPEPAETEPLETASRARVQRWRQEVVGRAPGFVEALQQAALVSGLDIHVLLTGDSGTGKTQLARLIHEASRRAGGPFVELNCATLPENLVESELFGAAAGAHSAARVALPGKISAARHGTLFLDEIGELPPAAQAKLLQFLQSGQYYPLGSTRACTSEVRVISASNIDLHRAVAEKRFRADLLYRLEVIPIHLPDLAERTEDVADLAHLFCRRAAERHGLPPARLAATAVTAIETARWPGNIRQLQHAVEAAVIRAAGEGRTEVAAHHVFRDAVRGTGSAGVSTFQDATRRFQSSVLRRALEESDWNVAECARRLDLARSHAYTLIREFGLQREERC